MGASAQLSQPQEKKPQQEFGELKWNLAHIGDIGGSYRKWKADKANAGKPDYVAYAKSNALQLLKIAPGKKEQAMLKEVLAEIGKVEQGKANATHMLAGNLTLKIKEFDLSSLRLEEKRLPDLTRAKKSIWPLDYFDGLSSHFSLLWTAGSGLEVADLLPDKNGKAARAISPDTINRYVENGLDTMALDMGWIPKEWRELMKEKKLGLTAEQMAYLKSYVDVYIARGEKAVGALFDKAFLASKAPLSAEEAVGYLWQKQGKAGVSLMASQMMKSSAYSPITKKTSEKYWTNVFRTAVESSNAYVPKNRQVDVAKEPVVQTRKQEEPAVPSRPYPNLEYGAPKGKMAATQDYRSFREQSPEVKRGKDVAITKPEAPKLAAKVEPAMPRVDRMEPRGTGERKNKPINLERATSVREVDLPAAVEKKTAEQQPAIKPTASYSKFENPKKLKLQQQDYRTWEQETQDYGSRARPETAKQQPKAIENAPIKATQQDIEEDTISNADVAASRQSAAVAVEKRDFGTFEEAMADGEIKSAVQKKILEMAKRKLNDSQMQDVTGALGKYMELFYSSRFGYDDLMAELGKYGPGWIVSSKE